MSYLNIGSPPGGNPQAQIDWLVQAVFAIQRAIIANDPATTIMHGFQLNDRNALTPVRTLDETGATLADVRTVLATVIDDFNALGTKAR